MDSLERTAKSRLEELRQQPFSVQNESWMQAASYQLDRCARIREATRKMSADDIHIAVTHVPLSEGRLRDLRDLANESIYLSSISLVIAGHYNAGQWRLPGLGALWVPETFPLRKTGFFPSDAGLAGAQTATGVTQFISTGLGASCAYPGLMHAFRLFNEPRVSLIKLTRIESGTS